MMTPLIAVEHLRAACRLTDDPAQASSVVSRLADLLAKEMGQKHAAAQALEDFIRRFPESKFADFARERLAGLS